ncbi:hypothetical protein [Actinoplanes subtropicus]|uniref:hypothetical protein n=1 Tax=Actinoplanes subtropicus TaxID=543632 RepID=UPI000A7499F3|nr:hypothetical protein [Actinoplanes subtropicus]
MTARRRLLVVLTALALVTLPLPRADPGHLAVRTDVGVGLQQRADSGAASQQWSLAPVG